MPTTVRDLLDEASLGLVLLVDGDLDRELSWVHVTELADPSEFLDGDELVLTAGVWRGRHHSATSFVRALGARHVAGIGYGVLAEDETVPTALVTACRRAGVPLVLVPVATPFIAVSRAFVERLAVDRERDLRDTLRLTSDLLRTAERSRGRRALGEVARLLHRSTGRDVWIADSTARLVGLAGLTPDPITVRTAAAGRSVPSWTVHAVQREDGGAAAVLAVGGEDLDLTTRARIDAARPVIGLVLARERAVRESERRLAGEVVSLLLGRQIEAASARLTSYGLDPRGSLVAVVLAVSHREQALPRAEAWLDDNAVNAVVALRGDELYVVADGRAADGPDGVRGLALALVHRLGATAAGAGAPARGAGPLRRSLVQARQACELARRRGAGTVVTHEATGSHLLLLALQDEDVVAAFRTAILAPLEDHDARTGSELVTTLRAFLETGGRWQATATRLHVHVNTLRHRLDKVEALTGREVDATADRVDLWLALEAGSA